MLQRFATFLLHIRTERRAHVRHFDQSNGLLMRECARDRIIIIVRRVRLVYSVYNTRDRKELTKSVLETCSQQVASLTVVV